MNRKIDVDDFLAQEKIAVVGVSRQKNKFGNMIFRELKQRNRKVFAVNPSTDTVEDGPCYRDLKSLPEPVDGAILVIRPQQSEQVVKDAVEAGIKRIWLQNGAHSAEAVSFCQKNNITVVANECILMFLEPVAFIHRLHRGLNKLFGKFPK